MRRWYTRDGIPIEIVECDTLVAEPINSVLDRIHLDWDIAAAMQRHGALRCQTAMEELILETLSETIC